MLLHRWAMLLLRPRKVAYAGGSPITDQDSFRIRNDDGDETTATWKANVNTDDSLDVDTNWRIRFLIQNTGTGNLVFDVGEGWRLQYNLAAAGWNDVTGASSVVRASASPNVTDNIVTTQQLGAGVFDTTSASRFDEGDGLAGVPSGSEVFNDGDESEPEFCFQILSGDVTNGQTLQLRIVHTQPGSNTVLDSYTNTPTITVVEGGAPANLRRYSLALSGVG